MRDITTEADNGMSEVNMKLPCWIVLRGRNKRWLFKKFNVSAGPKMCTVSRKEKPMHYTWDHNHGTWTIL